MDLKYIEIRVTAPPLRFTVVVAIIATQQPDVLVSAYTKCDVQLIKVAPDDGLIQSETCRVFNRK